METALLSAGGRVRTRPSQAGRAPIPGGADTGRFSVRCLAPESPLLGAQQHAVGAVGTQQPPNTSAVGGVAPPTDPGSLVLTGASGHEKFRMGGRSSPGRRTPRLRIGGQRPLLHVTCPVIVVWIAPGLIDGRSGRARADCRAASAPRRERRACGAGRLATGRRGCLSPGSMAGALGAARITGRRTAFCRHEAQLQALQEISAWCPLIRNFR